MKKILTLILIATLFAACGDDDDEPNYIDRELIAGDWYWINGLDSTIMWFENGLTGWVVYNKYDQSVLQRRNHGEYKLTEERIFYMSSSSGKGLKYRLYKDSIWIENGSDTENFIKYIKVK